VGGKRRMGDAELAGERADALAVPPPPSGLGHLFRAQPGRYWTPRHLVDSTAPTGRSVPESLTGKRTAADADTAAGVRSRAPQSEHSLPAGPGNQPRHHPPVPRPAPKRPVDQRTLRPRPLNPAATPGHRKRVTEYEHHAQPRPASEPCRRTKQPPTQGETASNKSDAASTRSCRS
jgi:hypothetical protein